MRRTVVLGIALSFLAVAFLTGASGSASAAPSGGSSSTNGKYQFASVPNPTAVAATPGQLLVLSGCSQVFSVSASGGVGTPVANLPNPPSKCPEGAIAISSGLDNFPAREVYVLVGNDLYNFSLDGGPITSTTVPSNLSGAYAGLTFDDYGAFGYGLLATGGRNGNVYLFSPDVTAPPHWLGSVGTYVEGPTVTPSTFGKTVSATLLMAAEGKSTLYSFAPDGTVQTFGSWKNSEAVSVVPGLACTYSTSGDAYFIADSSDGAVLGFSVSQLKSLSSGASPIVGQGLVLSEYKGLGVGLLDSSNGTTSQLIPLSGALEGAAYVSCPVGVAQTFDPATQNNALTAPDLIGFDPANGQLVGVNQSVAPNHVFFAYCSTQGCSYNGTKLVGTQPTAVAYDHHTNELFVANNVSDNLTVLDAANPTGPSLGSVPTGSGPDAVVFSPTNSKLYVANYGDSNLSVYSVPNNIFSNNNISLGYGSHPTGLAYDPIDNNTYVVGNVDGTGTVWEIHAFAAVGSLSLGAGTPGLPSGSNATAIAVNVSSGQLYVTLSAANAVAIVAPGSTTAPPTLVGIVSVGTDPMGIAYDVANGLFLVTNYEDGTIGIIQGQTMIATITLGAHSDPGVLVYDPVTQLVYVAANYAVPDPRIILGTSS